MHDRISQEVVEARHADHPVDPIFLNRWSPRAFSPREVPEEILMSAFEAARWAASSGNEQPWRFVMARSAEDRERFVSFLMPGNQVWAKDAPVLVVVCSKKTNSKSGAPNRCHQFDAGAAASYMTLSASLSGLVAHGMAGFDQDAARATLGLPTDFEPIAVFAIGYHGDPSLLPEELQAREIPSDRRPAKDSIMEGRFISEEEAAAEKEIDPGA